MATKADELKAEAQVANSKTRRTVTGVKKVTASMEQKRATLTRKTHQPLHARTKSLRDAKAGKPGDGKKVDRWLTGPNGGEDQTTNGVGGTGRGSDGPPGPTSRKSTRGGGPAAEKLSTPKTTQVKSAVHTPSMRAARGK